MDTTSRINEMEQSIKTIAEFVKEQTEELKNQAVTMRHLEELEDKMEKKYEDTSSLRNRYSHLDDSLRELKAMMSKRHDEDERLEEMERKVEDISRKASKSNFPDLESVKKELRELESLKSDYSDIKDRLSGFTEAANKNTAVYRTIDAYAKRLDELEKRASTSKIPVADNKIANEVDNLVKDIYRVRKALDEESAQRIATDKDMQDTKEKIGELMTAVNKMKGFGGDYSKLADAIQKEKKADEELEKRIGEEKQSMNKIRDEIKKEVSSLRSEMNSKLSASPVNGPAVPLTDMERKEIKLVKAELEALQQAMDRFQTTLEKLKEVKGLDTYEELTENMNDIRRSVDEESAQRIATDKNLQDMKQRLEDISFAVNKFKGFEEIDFSKLKNIMQQEKKFDEEAEKKMDIQASKIVTRQLNEFSRNLDKRLPNLVTRDDLAKLEARLAKSHYPAAKKPEYIDDRLAGLEFTINTMLHELRATGHGSKPPFVIE